MRDVVGKLFLILLFLSVPVSGMAQPAKDSWGNLKQLASGQQIWIVLNDAKSYSGQFQSVSNDGIVLRLGKDNQMFERQNVLRVSTKGASHRKRNALIGAGIGFAVGLGTGAAESASNRKEWPQNKYTEAGAIVGVGLAGVGALIGAVLPTGGWHDVYRAR
jgi:hypothetical protein